MEEMRVLVVDDEREFLDIVSKRLRKRKVNLDTAGSGEEALVRLKEGCFDVVVLDMRMPGMDGLETLGEIKNQGFPVEVIMLTGHADVDAAVKGMQLGAFDYLMKPVEIDELLYRIQDAFEKKTLGTR